MTTTSAGCASPASSPCARRSLPRATRWRRALDALEPEPTGLYLHVDLDVLDAEAAQVNIYSVPDGISADQLVSRVEQVLETGAVKAMSLTAYDPECDREGRVPPVADRLLRAAASAQARVRGAT